MIDMFPPSAEGLDLGIYDTPVPRAANILDVQFGSLEYAQTFGIDLAFFLSSDFKFQNASFKAYCIEVLASWGINVTELTDVVDRLSHQYIFEVSQDETSSTQLVER